jgi:uncharacterized protein
MIHPHTELQYIDAQIGYGVVATRLIPRGTITWVSDALDQVFPPEQKPALPALLQDQLDTYSFRDSDGNYILCWDHARFVNHSCRANCLSADFNCELAVRDILPGEELTDDYGTLNIESSSHARAVSRAAGMLSGRTMCWRMHRCGTACFSRACRFCHGWFNRCGR